MCRIRMCVHVHTYMKTHIMFLKVARGLRCSLAGQDAEFPPGDRAESFPAGRMHSVVSGGLRAVSFDGLIRLPACLLFACLLCAWHLVCLKFKCLPQARAAFARASFRLAHCVLQTKATGRCTERACYLKYAIKVKIKKSNS